MNVLRAWADKPHRGFDAIIWDRGELLLRMRVPSVPTHPRKGTYVVLLPTGIRTNNVKKRWRGRVAVALLSLRDDARSRAREWHER